jgi:hypothetical protein
VQSRRSVAYRGCDPRTADAPVLQGTSTPRSSTRTIGVARQGTGTVVDSLARADTRCLSSGSSFTLGRREGDDNVLIKYLQAMLHLCHDCHLVSVCHFVNIYMYATRTCNLRVCRDRTAATSIKSTREFDIEQSTVCTRTSRRVLHEMPRQHPTMYGHAPQHSMTPPTLTNDKSTSHTLSK